MADPGVLYRFAVTVDGLDLGAYTECKGLGATYTLEPVTEGGSLAPTAQLLKAVSYADVTLIRPIDESSGTVAAWFSAFADAPKPTTARIAACDSSGATICAWNLRGVVPKMWGGPGWNVKTSEVAMESLVLAHTGFTVAGDAAASAGPNLSSSPSLGVG